MSTCPTAEVRLAAEDPWRLMRSRPFESAASELVDEGAHPVEQLAILEERAKDLAALGDVDAVIECRIKQLALHRVLGYLHDFPLVPLIRAQAALAEAYAGGGYFMQAREHIAQAREICGGGVYDDVQCQRLQADMLATTGVIELAEGHLDMAERSLTEALRLGREVRGEMDLRAARVHLLLGQVAQQRKHYDNAIEHFSAAWEVHECLDGAEGEATLRARLQVAEAEHLAGRDESAIESQTAVVEALQRSNALPAVMAESAARLARWLEACGRDSEALSVLQSAEQAVIEKLGPEDLRAVDVKRDVALLHLKLGDHDTALQYLHNVHYLERRLHGSQSANVARTLKALGTVHLVRRNLGDAEHCLLQALRIFEADASANSAVIRDIHAKLKTIAADAG